MGANGVPLRCTTIAPLRVRRMKHLSLKGVLIAAVLPVAALVMFYSMAAHMYLSLGHWPQSIGDDGFSPALVFHGKAQYWWIGLVARISLYIWPVAVVGCAVISKARRVLPYLGVYALAVLLCWGLTYLAPERFLDWWFD